MMSTLSKVLTADIKNIKSKIAKNNNGDGMNIDMSEHKKLGDSSSMNHWWGIISKLDIPVPKTKMIKLPSQRDQLELLGGKPLDSQFYEELESIVKSLGKYPVFIRGDCTSAKHGWSHTCYIADENTNLPRHIFEMIDFTFGASMCGELENNSLYIREFIPLKSAGFTAFAGMPISKEVRCFIKDGKKQCQHEYWFAEAVGDTASVSDYKKRLDDLNNLSNGDQKTIDGYLMLVAGKLSEYWSVDFAQGEDDVWYLLDMARGETSYHHTCKYDEGNQ